MRLFREGKLLLPRPGARALGFHEAGITGFGDRLRGIALALFLCKIHRLRTLYYNDFDNVYEDPLEQAYRQQAFPFRMTELIDIQGIDFCEAPLPFPKGTLRVTHTCSQGTSLKRYGFGSFHRVIPKNPQIDACLDQLGVGAACVGLHVRGTDARFSKRFAAGDDYLRDRALAELADRSRQSATRRVFLAADNSTDRADWLARLEDSGYEVLCNTGAVWQQGALRQTGCEDMLVDFFGLARCSAIVRLVPSEFSRFAAWKAGIRMRYQDGFDTPSQADRAA